MELAIAAALMATLGVLPGPRAALAKWFGVGHVAIDLESPPISLPTPATFPAAPVAVSLPIPVTLPSAPTSGGDVSLAAAPLKLGQTVELDDQRLTGWSIPTSGALGPPALISVEDRANTRAVHLVWAPSTTAPDTPIAGVGALLTLVRGSFDTGFYFKGLAPDTPRPTLVAVKVGEADGAFIGGAPHLIVYLDPEEGIVSETARLAANVVIWTVGDTTFRLETALGRDAAVALANSFRTPA